MILELIITRLKRYISKIEVVPAPSVYHSGTFTCDILGDGTGGQVSVTVDKNGKITDAVVTSGGQGYTYGIVDLTPVQNTSSINDVDRAKLIPIIPPSRGHGFDLYTELGADKILIYSRFDDSTQSFPTSTKILSSWNFKNPEKVSDSTIFDGINFSSAFAAKIIFKSNQRPRSRC